MQKKNLKENLERKVELYKSENEEKIDKVIDGEIIEVSSKELDTLRKKKVKSLEETAKLDGLTIQAKARKILDKNMDSFTGALAGAEPKEFANMMKTLSDISGVTKKGSDQAIMIPIQINLDI